MFKNERQIHIGTRMYDIVIHLYISHIYFHIYTGTTNHVCWNRYNSHQKKGARLVSIIIERQETTILVVCTHTHTCIQTYKYIHLHDQASCHPILNNVHAFLITLSSTDTDLIAIFITFSVSVKTLPLILKCFFKYNSFGITYARCLTHGNNGVS